MQQQSGLTAERLRMDVISTNIANANTTRQEGGAIKRRYAVLSRAKNAGSFSSFLQQSANKLAAGDGVRAVIQADTTQGPMMRMILVIRMQTPRAM